LPGSNGAGQAHESADSLTQSVFIALVNKAIYGKNNGMAAILGVIRDPSAESETC
jgi:hypothetical protein